MIWPEGLMQRREFLLTAGIASLTAFAQPLIKISWADDSFELEEATILQLQDAMSSGKISSRQLAEMYIKRIGEIDKAGPAINSMIQMNPEAMQIAESLDRERKQKRVRGPLHGIPVLIKDNIDTADKMMTTAGSLALLGSTPPQDSFVAKKLRE